MHLVPWHVKIVFYFINWYESPIYWLGIFFAYLTFFRSSKLALKVRFRFRQHVYIFWRSRERWKHSILDFRYFPLLDIFLENASNWVSFGTPKKNYSKGHPWQFLGYHVLIHKTNFLLVFALKWDHITKIFSHELAST